MKTLSTKVSPGMMQTIDDYAEEIGESRSVATRELLQEALREKAAGGIPLTHFIFFMGTMLFFAAFADTSPETGYFGGLVALFGLLFSFRSVRRRSRQIRERIKDIEIPAPA